MKVTFLVLVFYAEYKISGIWTAVIVVGLCLGTLYADKLDKDLGDG